MVGKSRLAGLTKRKAAVICFRYMAILGSLILALVGLNSGCEVKDRVTIGFVAGLSGYTEDVMAHQGIINTTINLILKPFSIQAIAAKLGEVLDH